MWWIAAGVSVVCILWLWLIAPGRADKQTRAAFSGRTYAHRGLYEVDQSVPENSLEAFRRAVSAGYGIELDVQLSKDGQVLVFHDDTLQRACGENSRVDATSFLELHKRTLFGTMQHIPLLSEVLATVSGRVPLIVELKAGSRWQMLCEKTYKLLSDYEGPYCVESFHPSVVRWFYRHAPKVMRGQLSEAYCFSLKHIGRVRAFVLSRLFTNAFTRPQFVAYRIGPKCVSARICEMLGAIKVAWTVQDSKMHAEWTARSDMVIFEHYRPQNVFCRNDDGNVVCPKY